jgi:uncharacterized membrane protein YbhN (UPF0104 family)
MRKHLSTLLKVGITLLGLWLVLTRFDAAAIALALQTADLGWLAVGFVLVNAGVVLRAYRWFILIRSLEAPVTFGRLTELYFVGGFFNTFLPSGFGGDVVRIMEVSQDVPSGVAAGTVIIDRLTGLMMLFALSLLALPFRPPDFPPQLLAIIVSICVLGLAGGLVILEGSLLERLSAILPGRLLGAGNGFIPKTAAAVKGCGWRAIGGAMLVSVLFNLLQAVWWTTTGWALGLQIPYLYTLLVVPIFSLAMLIPSIGGLGVREVLAPVLFAGAGVPPEQAVALTLLVFGLEKLSGLLGGPVYLYTIWRDGRKTAPHNPI